jgi:hypothetical protein
VKNEMKGEFNVADFYKTFLGRERSSETRQPLKEIENQEGDFNIFMKRERMNSVGSNDLFDMDFLDDALLKFDKKDEQH